MDKKLWRLNVKEPWKIFQHLKASCEKLCFTVDSERKEVYSLSDSPYFFI